MSTFKHTPGPWYGRPHFDPILIQGGPEVGLELAFACGGGNPRRAEFQANARLIAAAPDLLEALESVLANCLDSEGLASAHAKARAAIAKATQEPQE